MENLNYTVVFEISGKTSSIRHTDKDASMILDAAQQARIPLRADCGGKGICGKCRVRLAKKNLPEPTENERRHFPSDLLAKGWRLACQTVVSTNTEVYVPNSSLVTEQVSQVESMVDKSMVDSAIRLLTLRVPPPSLNDQLADFDRLKAQLIDFYRLEPMMSKENDTKGIKIGVSALSTLSEALREGDWEVTLGLYGQEVIAAYPGSISVRLGLAVDIGTTNLAFYLVDLETGKTIDAKGIMNPQVIYGDDIMSRLELALSCENKREALKRALIAVINKTVAELCEAHGVKPQHVLDVCFVCNTAMHHLLLGLPVKSLAFSPFVASTASPLKIPVHFLGLHAAPGASVYLPPPVAGFVGSDLLSFLLAVRFYKDNRTILGIDIGTNTEIAIKTKGRIVVCSAASGPAFEGAHVRQGMKAGPGAIKHITVDDQGNVHCEVIGNQEPIGICGSGMLDALAEMYKRSVIDQRGHLRPGVKNVFYESDGSLSYLLVPKGKRHKAITISSTDINQMLLAKGAIRAGIDIMFEYLGLKADQIDEVFIAGSFGTHLDPSTAQSIGLLPKVPLERMKVVGNAAGAGAQMMLISEKNRHIAETLAQRIEYLELTTYTNFSWFFVKDIRLPPSEC